MSEASVDLKVLVAELRKRVPEGSLVEQFVDDGEWTVRIYTPHRDGTGEGHITFTLYGWKNSQESLVWLAEAFEAALVDFDPEERAAMRRYFEDYHQRKVAWINNPRLPEPEPLYWPHPDWWPVEEQARGDTTITPFPLPVYTSDPDDVKPELDLSGNPIAPPEPQGDNSKARDD